MDRKKFLTKGLIGLGTIVALPSVVASCSEGGSGETDIPNTGTTTGGSTTTSGDCTLSPSETAGPFPIKTPADLMKENIVSDRSGVALLITLTIQNKSDSCNPLEGVYVDLWHCDSEGNYSEYGGTRMQATDYTSKHFLRGRQTTDTNGQVSFISIFPGWYQGRAPHIHLEVLDQNENSLKVTQIAFPKGVCDTVYATEGYNGEADTLNTKDNVFSDSLDDNMLDDISGNTKEGYTLLKTVVV